MGPKTVYDTANAPLPRHVGRPTRRIDWNTATSGATHYVADRQPPGELVARILRSPHPHARITRLDTDRAARMPGVAAIVTATDLAPGVRYTHQGPRNADRLPLATDRVRYIGEEIAAVAAVDRETADAALRAIDVGYRTLPAVTDVAAALRRGAVTIHDHRPGNVAVEHHRDYGVDEVPDGSIHVQGVYLFRRQAHVCLETNRATALWHDDREVLELWTSTQSPLFVRKDVARCLGLETEQVLMRDVAVGGGFGSKSKISEFEVALAALARKVPGRPVTLTYDRHEEFSATKPRHATQIALSTYARPDGELLGHRAQVDMDNGAYNHYGPSVLGAACGTISALHRTHFVKVDGRLIYTNTAPGGQFRGYGTPQATFAVESQMDELADALGMDPIEFRLRNAVRTGDVAHTGWRFVHSGIVRCLETLRERTDWATKRAAGGNGYGIGMAIAVHVSGSNSYAGSSRSEGRITIDDTGAVAAAFGSGDAGTGQRTIIAQVVAEVLGLDPSEVDVTMMDSEAAPPDFGAWSSRGTHMAGHAMRDAAERTADHLRALAGDKLGVPPGDIELRDGEARSSDASVRFGDLVRLSDQLDDQGHLRVDGSHEAGTDLVDPDGAPRNISPTYSFAAQAVEVEVDVETGRIHVTNVTAVHDSGTPINPTDAEGQVVGGVAMGLGAALGEEVLLEGGRVLNPSMLHYALPRAVEAPPVEVIFLDDPDPVGPYGAKGIGEIVLNPTAAALANAVTHATGLRIRELPITPDRLVSAQRSRTGQAKRPGRIWSRPGRWWVAAIRWLYPRGLHRVLHRYGVRLTPPPQPPSSPPTIYRPTDANAATTALRELPQAQPIGGASDIVTARAQGLVRADNLVAIGGLEEASGIRVGSDGNVVIGCASTLYDLLKDPHTRPLRALREAVEQIASHQIRNVATVGGNLAQEKRCWFYRNDFPCYKRAGAAAPCFAVLGDHRFHHAVIDGHRCQAVTPSDLATILAAYGATAIAIGPHGEREIAITDLYRGPGETVLLQDEFLTRVVVPASATTPSQAFEKLALWDGDFAMVAAATRLTMAAGRVADARIVLGAVSPVPFRARDAERLLVGSRGDPRTVEHAAGSWVKHAHPLDGNAWKLDAGTAVLRRSIERALIASDSRESRSHL